MADAIWFSMQKKKPSEKKWTHVTFCDPQTARDDCIARNNSSKGEFQYRIVDKKGVVIYG